MTTALQTRDPPDLAPVGDRGGARQPMLSVRGLRKYFPIRGGVLNRRQGDVKAVDGVSFEVLKGETLGIVGESGCGKSTLARLLMHLLPKDDGELVFDGEAIGGFRGLSLRDLRRNLQMVFQDSASSLNPRMAIYESIAYGPSVHGVSRSESRRIARDLLVKVGLEPELFAARYPHELSGGQKQRVNIARALALNPRMLILDEAVSALDKSVQAQVLNLLRRLKREFDLTFVFISHDLDVVQFISDRVLVMYLGEIVEIGPVDAIYESPRHPYTSALLRSRLSTDPAERLDEPPISGDPPNPVDPPSGCRFRTRCVYAEPVCETRHPGLFASDRESSHRAACHMLDPVSGHTLAGASPLHVAQPAARRS